MLYRIIDADDIPSLIRAFMDSYELVAPVARGQGYVFDEIENPDDVVLDYPTTIASPKKFFLPPRETLFAFDVESNDVAPFELDVKPRVLFGVHPCDLNAIERLDAVFLDPRYCDPYYRARREATLIVGIGCTPSQSCFCHRVGADEASRGYDLFLQDLGDRYWVSISSVAAAEVLEESTHLREADDADRAAFAAATRRRTAGFNEDIPNVQDVAMLMDTYHSDPFWEELGARCLNCTACASVCPTCMCFDIKDVLSPDAKTGERIRTWDSCTSPEFAQVAGGHNFREDERRRVRHRMYHKLNGFKVKHGSMLCVGCGRCVNACKTDISPIEVLRFFDEKTRMSAAIDKEGRHAE
ncbi:MAG: 4Fe-4S dicluster domain-containing protein [Slackia sp.]|nr:4Fe-4S dicluster domain-containing protein [Slackia sp.]